MPQWFQRPITKYKCVLRRLCLPESNPHPQILHWFFFLSKSYKAEHREYICQYIQSHKYIRIRYNIAQDSTISVFSGRKTIQLHSSDHSWMYSYHITNLRIPFSFIFFYQIQMDTFLGTQLTSSSTKSPFLCMYNTDFNFFYLHRDTSNCAFITLAAAKIHPNFTIYSTMNKEKKK